jgi:hypothetical protein
MVSYIENINGKYVVLNSVEYQIYAGTNHWVLLGTAIDWIKGILLFLVLVWCMIKIGRSINGDPKQMYEEGR